MPILFRQEGCLLKYSENGEQGPWLLAADLKKCQLPETPASDPSRICNGSVQLAEWLMLFLEHNIEQIGSSTDLTQAIISGVLEFFDEIPFLESFIETLRGLIGVAAGSLTSPIYRQNVQKALYCRIVAAGKFDKTVFDDWVDLDSLPSDAISYHLSQLAKSLPFDELLKRYQIYSLDASSVCDLFEDCDPPCKLSAPQTGAFAGEFTTTESQSIQDQWKLASNPNIHPPGSSAYYFALFKLPYASSRCRIEITANDIHTFQLQPSPDGRILLYPSADPSQVEIYTNLLDLNGKCFNSFAINGQGPLDVDIRLSECIPEAKACPLYFMNSTNNRQLIPADADGNVSLNSYGSLAPTPDTNGFRRYYLQDENSCCKLQRLPLNESGDLGIVPTKLRVYACGAGETYTEYTYPTDAQAFNDFFGRITCFNSFALAPSYVIKVRLAECGSEEELNLRPLTQAEEDGQSSGNTIVTAGSVSKLSATTFRLSSGVYFYPGVGNKYTLNVMDNDAKCFRIISRTIVSGAPDIGATGNREFTFNCLGGGGFSSDPSGRCVKQYGVDDMPAGSSAPWVLDLEVEFCND